MKRLVLQFLIIILSQFCYVNSIDYTVFNSIDEVINFETNCIQIAMTAEDLSDAYASRGESLLLENNFEAALEDFICSYTHAQSIPDKEISQSSMFRALFNQALTYGNLNETEKVIVIGEELKRILQEIDCDCGKDFDHSSISLKDFESNEEIFHILEFKDTHVNNFINKDNQNPILELPWEGSSSCKDVHTSTNPLFLKCGKDVRISGPDQISIKQCLEFVENTVIYAKLLIAKAPPAARALLIFIIEQLGRQASRCCHGGGLWKGCVQKLVNKFHLWNQKWKVFGIPPDPAWD